MRIATAINGLICLLIESDPDWNLKSAQIAAIMNLGTQANGSWRNAIGVEGANRVKELLVGYLLQIGALEKITLSDGTEITPSVPSPSIQETRALAVKSGYILTFGSEPDVSIRDPQDTLISTIEVKYGLDPAGALERYGAAMRSFQAAARENARVVNIYLASCFTPELRRRMNEDRLVNQDFNLLEVLRDTDKRLQFLDYIRHLLGL